MSAVYAYAVSLSVAGAVSSVIDRLTRNGYDPWLGVGPPRYLVRFWVRLPAEVNELWTLHFRTRKQVHTVPRWWRPHLRAFAAKTALGLGLPFPDPPLPGEERFINALKHNPRDLGLWSVYADWLRELGELRGDVMAGWLDPKVRLRSSRGFPLIARR